ncbi:MAG: translation initiation factor IF-2 [Nanoarchaeota archaeon]|nr:translation initiation factor IF-2 [Nanoarchaeota archaeon]MBU1704419.1 translation initiation factor IF-2 [Nanoarchaeota archaeon]
MTTRSLICTTLGHVDHGKSSILDKIRGSAIVKSEAGAITQAIGASIIPLSIIRKICGQSLDALNMKLTIPGLLFIDTPGHAAFTNLRKRGGNLADIAILVIDINEGLMPQTVESIEILKTYKTPFVIAANKIDKVSGWKSSPGPVLENIKKQTPQVLQLLETKIYGLVGKLAELGFESERFDRIEDYTKQIAIIPTSAITGEGISEILMVLTGLAQKFLQTCLNCEISGPAKGTILEVKEAKGLGKCLDVIIYDGTLKKNDTVVIGSLDKPIVAKIRGLFEPAPLAEMRDKKSKFVSIPQAVAATGVRISAPGIDEVLSGMPIRAATPETIEKIKQEIQKEVDEVVVATDEEGIVIKADTLGSLEALAKLLREKGITIKKASIGDISKKDIADAEANFEKDPLMCIILGFNAKDNSGICNDRVKIFSSDIIYKLIEDFELWQIQAKKTIEQGQIDLLIRPAKIEIMKGYVFRQSNPAVVGADIIAGVIKSGTPLMNKNGKEITEIKSMQHEQESVDKAEKGKQVAVALTHVTVGRQINEGDILYSSIPEEHFKKFKELKQYLSKEEIAILKEIAEIKRKDNPVWGV